MQPPRVVYLIEYEVRNEPGLSGIQENVFSSRKLAEAYAQTVREFGGTTTVLERRVDDRSDLEEIADLRKERRSNPKKRTSGAGDMVRECKRLWEHYCERPGKTRLKAVLKHCEKMAESSAKSVKEERARCMRSARREMKKLGMK